MIFGLPAALWHQGESDALNCTAASSYVSLLKCLIDATRTDAGFTVAWGVATASNIPGGTAACMNQVTAAQAQVVQTTAATFVGPNTDGFRANGWTWDNVHFNATGPQQHGQRWYAAVKAWGGVPT